MVGAAPERPDEFHGPESPDPAADRAKHTPGATAAPGINSSRSDPPRSSSPRPNSPRSSARRSDADTAGRRTDSVRQSPERWADICCSHATRTPSRDATRTLRSGSLVWTLADGKTPEGAPAKTESDSAEAAKAVEPALDAGIKSFVSNGMSIAAAEPLTPKRAELEPRASESRESLAASSSVVQSSIAAPPRRSHSQSHAAQASDITPPSPGTGENSWLYSPHPNRTTGVAAPFIAVTPTAAPPGEGPSHPPPDTHRQGRPLPLSTAASPTHATHQPAEPDSHSIESPSGRSEVCSIKLPTSSISSTSLLPTPHAQPHADPNSRSPID